MRGLMGNRSLWGVASVVVVLSALAIASASAQASVAGTGWEATTFAYPSHLPPGGTGRIDVEIVNMGALPATGNITVTDTLPAGVTATAAGGGTEGPGGESPGGEWVCTGTAVVTCTGEAESRALRRMPFKRIAIEVSVLPNVAGELANRVTVTGGGAVGATSVSDPVVVSATPPSFGFSGWHVWLSNASGTPDTQAGSHPYQVMFALGFNQNADGKLADGEIRNLEAVLPPGFFGDPNAVPECTRQQLDGQGCPPQTQVGIDVSSVGYQSARTEPADRQLF